MPLSTMTRGRSIGPITSSGYAADRCSFGGEHFFPRPAGALKMGKPLRYALNAHRNDAVCILMHT